MTGNREILVTAALPYANGPLHIGHMVEYIQADIWVRFQRLRGHTCHFVCGSDAHGTPIMLNAEKQQRDPEEMVKQIQQEHARDLSQFHVALDNFHTTHSDENKELVEKIYLQLQQNGSIFTKEIEQAYDSVKEMFLPDRYVKGSCPKCQATDQYGDSCEVCGATYDPTELVNPLSVLSKTTPIQKKSTHYFFDLATYSDTLQTWLDSADLQDSIKHKLSEWFEQGLKAWDISRDAPYFGFTIPGETDKFFYVWLDAPVGYLASLENYGEQKQLPNLVDHFFNKDSKAEVYHFVGKDIIYFHGLFWPAILHASSHRMPSSVYAHGFLTVNGEKMSKSRGTFITAHHYLCHLNPESLRYYFAAKLADGIEDIDLNLEDFVARTNSDLVGKYVNIASRVSKFLHQNFDGMLSDHLMAPELFDDFAQAGEEIAELYEKRQFSKAMREIMALADKANQFVDAHKPWQLIKNEHQKDQVQHICTMALNLFYMVTTYLAPVLPHTTELARQFLQVEDLAWNWRGDIEPLLQQKIGTYEALMTRMDEKTVNELMQAEEAPKEKIQPKSAASTEKKAKPADTKPLEAKDDVIEIDDFVKVDLRVGCILDAEDVPEASKLLKLSVDLSNGDVRQIFAGIKQHYTPEQLIGKHVVVVANLKPRKMRFGLSEGMILCASAGDVVKVVSPEVGALPGTAVK